jgi:protein TonB
MFCLLAAARTTPSLLDTEKPQSLRIITLDIPIPTKAEPEISDTVMAVIQQGEQASNNETNPSLVDMVPSTQTREAARIPGLSFELPGLAVRTFSLPLLNPVPAKSVGGLNRSSSTTRVDRFPSRISGPSPRYPQWARRDHLEGVVILRFIVTTQGTVETIYVHDIQGDERFGEEAIGAVRQWRFSPAIKAGKPVPCWCLQTINFTFTR